MLDTPQEHVGVAQLPVLALAHQPREQELIERAQRPALAQAAPSPTVDQLERLHEELDLPDPAATELDVLVIVKLSPDARHERVHLVDRARGAGARPHEGLQQRERLFTEAPVTGDRTRLDPRLPLPRPTPRLVIAL